MKCVSRGKMKCVLKFGSTYSLRGVVRKYSLHNLTTLENVYKVPWVGHEKCKAGVRSVFIIKAMEGERLKLIAMNILIVNAYCSA